MERVLLRTALALDPGNIRKLLTLRRQLDEVQYYDAVKQTLIH